MCHEILSQRAVHLIWMAAKNDVERPPVSSRKHIIEYALGAEMSHHLEYVPCEAKPEDAPITVMARASRLRVIPMTLSPI
ncbi:MAG: hypothetical protein J0H48_03205 [Nitrosospira multiformis]|nr:hypothetical protein [Nitrosospira multiformis]